MAGDMDLTPSLRRSCIDAIADKIELYAKLFSPQNRNEKSPPDGGNSGSVMMDTSSVDKTYPMECDEPCLSTDVEMSARGDSELSRRVGRVKMLDTIASLDVKCHHTPPCGSEKGAAATTSSERANLTKIFIPNPISEDILQSVCKKGRLNDRIAEFFADKEQFRIRRMYLKKAGHLTSEGFKKLLSKHTLTQLNVEKINDVRQCSPLDVDKNRKKITIADVVSSINPSTKESLLHLNISGIPSGKEDWVPMAIYVNGGEFKKLSILTNIRSLDVSYTNFTDNDLNTVIACMKHLQDLDISGTFVRSILYLGDLNAPKLRSLSMSNLDRLNMPKESLFDVLCKMKNLHHLDISAEKSARGYAPNMIPNVNVAISMMMVGGFPLPNLVSLDISGRDGIEEVAFQNFYASHPSLSYLGLLLTRLDNLPCFTDEKHENFRSHVKVTGDRTEAQVVESLTRYYRRPFFAKEALFSLFHLTQLSPQYNKEQLELVLRCMRNHRTKDELSASVQMAATACVYNLTNREMVMKIPVPMLSKVVTETLVTMEAFKERTQLQKNCLLTLCSDRILKDVNFNYFKTAKLVIDCLCMTEDPAMHRMSVAIISILAAKISTEQTAILGGNNYMKALLRIVEQKLDENPSDLTLKFTLSALWNLTDESPTTCQNFIDCDGLRLFSAILDNNEDNPCIQTKVLGLLNNLAEVPALRHHLLQRNLHLVKSIHRLLHSKHIEVSYFAAGIISHLAMLDTTTWTELNAECKSKHLLQDLYQCVLAWDPPDGEMVAYRTFKPFFPLLRCHKVPAVQLWAAWAVRHVCMKNGEKYQEMLVEEEGLECLMMVKQSPNLDANVLMIIDSTLEFISGQMVAPEMS